MLRDTSYIYSDSDSGIFMFILAVFMLISTLILSPRMLAGLLDWCMNTNAFNEVNKTRFKSFLQSIDNKPAGSVSPTVIKYLKSMRDHNRTLPTNAELEAMEKEIKEYSKKSKIREDVDVINLIDKVTTKV